MKPKKKIYNKDANHEHLKEQYRNILAIKKLTKSWPKEIIPNYVR